jgi:hypothetical protein
MFQKILSIIIAILVGLLPFFASSLISKHSPYYNNNSFAFYIPICIAYAFLSALILFAIKAKDLPKLLFYGGALLFFIGACITSIFGLGAPPDTSTTMLQHPEREHFRYFMLFVALLLFAGAFALIIKEKWDVLSKWNKWIILFFIVSIAEMSWEFYHHYYYPENLQLWMDQGNNADDFIKAYDNSSIVRLGAIGRFFQYTMVAWLSYILLQYKHIRYGSFILLLILCFVGNFTAVFIILKGLAFPPNLQILFFFFIPGLPFILLYWLGVALLSKQIFK